MIYDEILRDLNNGEFKNSYEKFKKLKTAYGNLWAKIYVDYRKQKLPVWFANLESAFNFYSWDSDSVGKQIPVGSYTRDNGDRVVVDRNDLLPYDGTRGQIRYTLITNTDQGEQKKVYRAKVGKIVAEYIRYVEDPVKFPVTEKMLNFFREQTASIVVAKQILIETNDYKVVMDNDFEYIYSSCNHVNGEKFGSCQTDKKLFDFYDKFSECHAISLRDSNNKMVARAVVFRAYSADDPDKSWMAMERIYAASESTANKRMLIEMAKVKGLVEIYKDINAGPHDVSSWRHISNDEELDCKKRLFVKLVAPFEDDDTIAWGDSFRYYQDGANIVTNYETNDCVQFENYTAGENYSSINPNSGRYFYDEYLNENMDSNEETAVTAYYRGNQITLAESTRDRYFVYADYLHEYHHRDDVYWSEYEKDYIVEGDAVYSEHIEDYIFESNSVEVRTADGSDNMPKDHEDIVECANGYYVFVDNATYFSDIDEWADNNNPIIELNGMFYRIEQV